MSALTVPLRRRSPWRAVSAVAVTAVVVAAFWSVQISWGRLADLPADIGRYLWLMFSAPEWSKLPEALWQTWRSIEMAWVGTVLGILLATPLSLVATTAASGRCGCAACCDSCSRSSAPVPELIIAIIILSVTGLTPLTGALALAVNGIGTLGKWGLRSGGGRTSRALSRRRAPRAVDGAGAALGRVAAGAAGVPVVLALPVRDQRALVAVLGLIGVGGIGDMLTSYTQYREWSTVGMLLIVVIVVTMAIDAASGALRRRIMEGPRAR